MQLKELTCSTFDTNSNQNSKYQSRNMLCCGRRKNGKEIPDISASPGRAPGFSNMTTANIHSTPIRTANTNAPPAMVIQGDFRKVSGISSEIFKQIESIENDHDSTTAAALEMVERRGEMIVRILEQRQLSRQAQEHAKRFLSMQDAKQFVQLVEIVKRPGQTLGLYIREGNGIDRNDGVFISRIALESAVYNSGCLKVGDEILAVNFVDVTRMSLDDVVIIMSIPRRLVLVTRQRKGAKSVTIPSPSVQMRSEHKGPPVVIMKGDLKDEENNDILDNRQRGDTLRRQRLINEELNKTLPRRFERQNVMFNDEDRNINGDIYRFDISRAKNDNWSYQPPVITEQPKSRLNTNPQPYHSFDRTFPRTLESLAEKVHPFYSTQRRPNNNPYRSNINNTQQRSILRSGSDQYLPKTEYENELAYGGPTLNRHSLLRSSLKSSSAMVNQPLAYRYPNKFGELSSITNIHKPSKSNLVDYSSDTEAICGSKSNLYYYRSPLTNVNRNQTVALAPAVTDYTTKFSSLPRDNRIKFQLNKKFGLEPSNSSLDYGYSTDYSTGSLRHNYQPLSSSLSSTNFSANEYKTWLNRTPSTSAIYEQIRASRNLLNQQKAARFTYSAENIHSALKDSKYGYRFNKNLIPSSRLTSNTLPTQTKSILNPQQAPLSLTNTGTIPSLKRIRPFLELDSSTRSINNCPNPSPVPTPSHTLSRTHSNRQIDINPADFLKYKAEKNPSATMPPSYSLKNYDLITTESGLSGMLCIHLLAGRGLKSSASNTPVTPVSQSSNSVALRDLYCVIECDRVHKARTVVRTGDMVFDWDENFDLDLVNNKELDLLVYSWDPQYRHKLCYKGSVHLVTLLKDSPVHQLALKIEPRGTLYLRLKYFEPKELFKRKSIQNLSLTTRNINCPLFGNDIDKIINYEIKTFGAAHNIPLLVRKCIEEVERRGLDIIGLYRLCGSSTKKRILREAFERNCRTVDLSPENVPDINVITGVLKDFLRELTEPLFSKCVYQMMIDALGVCVPNDTEGSAKLMFSLLDYLPNVNRATLVFIIDHLALVVAASDRNKMSAQSLATVMAPPLIMHSQIDIVTGVTLKQIQGELNYTQPIGLIKYLLQIWPVQQKRQMSLNSSDCHKSIGTLGGTQNAYHPQRTNSNSTSSNNNNWHLTHSARTVYQAAHPIAVPDKVVTCMVTSPSYVKVSSTLSQSPAVNYSSSNNNNNNNNKSNNSYQSSTTISNIKIENIRKKSLDTIDEISNIIIASSSSASTSSSSSSSPLLSSKSSSTKLKSSPEKVTTDTLKLISSADESGSSTSRSSPSTTIQVFMENSNKEDNNNFSISSTNPFITGIYKQTSIDDYLFNTNDEQNNNQNKNNQKPGRILMGKLLFSSSETIEEENDLYYKDNNNDDKVKPSLLTIGLLNTEDELLLTPISSMDETEDSLDKREQGEQGDIEPSD